MEDEEIKDFVKKRYGKIADAGVSCCPSCKCEPDLMQLGKRIGYSENDLENLPETSNMGLGCGNPVALAALNEGDIVLDLGSGGGIDVFLAAKNVGPKGKVIGVDMTEEMIERARSTAKKYGYTNVEFRLGEIEDLPIEDNSVDVIISNCVINLSVDKEKVFREAHRVLKPGGKIMISDLVTKGKLPEGIKKSFDAWAGCVAGALEKNEYLDTIRKVGFKKVKIVSELSYDIDISEELKNRITSVEVEAYKVGR
jgi:arsenite methyltransferase